MVKWKYAMDELPETKRVRVRGQDLLDTEEVDKFFADKLNEKFNGTGEPAPAAAKPTSKPKAKKPAKEDVELEDQGIDDDVPF